MALDLAPVAPWIDRATAWAAEVDGTFARVAGERRWFTREEREALDATRPDPGLAQRMAGKGLLVRQPEATQRAVRLLDGDLDDRRSLVNELFAVAELESMRDFFDQIERTPLTPEQARAVLCMDNRVQLLAAAGSGKTSVMVARAAYAVTRGLVRPERILLLAFNRDAAGELRDRIDARTTAAGVAGMGITASTFHAFGLQVVGRATGKKPRLAPWLDNERDAQVKALALVDELRDQDLDFRLNWDLFRTVFGRATDEMEGGTPDRWDRNRKEPAFATFAGYCVRSQGERLIADWLYLNGVDFRYEAPYIHDTRDEEHGQYHPDFHYPNVDVWHEHWGIDAEGNPPKAFVGYLEAMAWKRQLHEQHGTTLVESTWADVMTGHGLRTLQTDLEAHGIEFDWNPDRPPRDDYAKPIEHEHLLRLMRSFMAHVKANDLDESTTRQRADAAGGGTATIRTRTFLDAYWAFHRRWQEELAASQAIDFDDMLAQAASLLEAGYDPGYEMVLVDEFQDTSRVRARIAAALVKPKGRYLLAVGDDWQAINRFAGSDVGVMTDFDAVMGAGPQLALTATFRCPQTICDVAARFVAKNPRQFDKPMRAADGRVGPPVRLIGTDDPTSSLSEVLDEIAASLPKGSRASVFLLVRFWFLANDPAVRAVLRRAPTNLDITVSTVHGSKGLEADNVIVFGVTGGNYGFPSEMEDDPVLRLAMPEPDEFEHAEERRLFYVALTRARHQVIVITDRTSPFVTELLADEPDPAQLAPTGFTHPTRVCPSCKKGTLQAKIGAKGSFLGCTAFPACGHTEPIRPDGAEDCPELGCNGWLEQRKGRFGPFLGCSNYWETGCRGKRVMAPEGAEDCPDGCGGHLRLVDGPHGKFWGCSNWRRDGGCRYTRSA